MLLPTLSDRSRRWSIAVDRTQITELGEMPSVLDVAAAFADPDAARTFLEALVWPTGAFCPFCGSTHVWRFRADGRKSRPGLHECSDCCSQFTVTTRTPLHSTKLPLVKWIMAIYLITTSSKGIASTVLGRWIGVPQETAWKVGHAIRELMDLRDENGPALSGVVEIDTKNVGGAPKYQRHVYHPPGRGTDKQPVLIAVERGGQVRASVVEGEARTDIEPVITAAVEPTAHLMSDKDRAVGAVGKQFAAHDTIDHGAKEFARSGGKGQPEIHSNTAESFGSQLERAQVGVFHQFGDHLLQRYVDEVAFRWNHTEREDYTDGLGRKRSRLVPGPFIQQAADLLRHAVGRQVRRSSTGGLRWPPPIAPGFRPAPSAGT
jgi:transposase-like protein